MRIIVTSFVKKESHMGLTQHDEEEMMTEVSFGLIILLNVRYLFR